LSGLSLVGKGHSRLTGVEDMDLLHDF